MICPFCNNKSNNKIIIKHVYQVNDWVHEQSFNIDMNYHFCNNCHNAFLSPANLKKINNKMDEFRANIIMNLQDNNEWTNIKDLNIDKSLLHTFMFYKKINKDYFVLNKSYEKYKRCGNGLFWIGKKYERFENNKVSDFYESLDIKKIKIDKNYLIHVFMMNQWISLNMKEMIFNIPYFNKLKNDFNNIKFYGYGGIIWNNEIALDNYTIWNEGNKS